MLYTLLREAAAIDPARTAIQHDARSITYGDLVLRVRAASENLRAAGVTRGSLVATCFDTKIDTIVFYYAFARLGARVVSLDSNSTVAELRQVFEQCGPSLVLTDARYLDNVRAALLGLDLRATVVSEGTTPLDHASLFQAPAAAGEDDDARTAEDGPFHVTFTSGSTGRPKGIVLSQRALARRITDWRSAAKLAPDDRHLCILTLSHAVGPQYGAFPALSTGATLHLMEPLQTTPLRALKYITEHRITRFLALPYFYQLMAAVPNGAAFDLSSLRLAMSVAAPLPAETAQAFFAKHGVALANGYGLSESGIIIFNDDRDAALAGSTIGRPIPGLAIRLLPVHGAADDGREPDEGEIAVRSETLADGYFSPTDPPMTKDGWLDTADVARRTPDGRYQIVGRLSQFINVGGSKVAPVEIEMVIGEIDGVREVAVVGVPDPRTTQKVAAFVVGDAGLTAERIRQHCREKLAGFKVPSHVEFRAELPKSSLGKILKTQLRASAPA
jgi:acyl-coenzyme A synthetase/AMP-(fatty) acid ligase